MKPNIFYFIMDDFPIDDMGAYYGKDRIYTPNIDAFAKEAVRFDRAYCASSVCTPSRYCHITGHYSGRNNDKKFLKENVKGDVSKINFNVVVNENIPNLMSFLKDAGYQTGYSGKWHCGSILETLEGMPNFDLNEPIDNEDVNNRIIAYQEAVQKELKKTIKVDYAKSIAWNNVDELPLEGLRQHNLEWMTKGSLEMLDAFEDDKPFCLYMATSTFHGPLHHKSLLDADPRYTWSGFDESLAEVAKTEREYIKNTLIEQGLEINHHTVGALWSDFQFKKIINALEAKGVLDNTIIVFAVDHGVEPGKGSCFEIGLRVPLMIKWNDGYRQGQSTNVPVQNIDLVPTLLAACDIEKPKDAVIDGVDIRELLDGKIERDSLYFEAGFNRAIIKNNMKYIALRYPQRILDDINEGRISMLPNCMDMEGQGQAGITLVNYKNALSPDQVYDLKVDRFEENNLIDNSDYKDVCQDLKTELQNYLNKFPDHPYNLDDYKVFDLPQIEELKARRFDLGMGEIEWWKPEDNALIRERMPNMLRPEAYNG